MRPGRLNPGKIARVSGHAGPPERFNEAGAIKPRKVVGFGVGHIGAGVASMRPGRLNPGKLPRVSTGSPARSCFNEAGAIKPRKVLRPPPLKLYLTGFNEAGAIKPRKALFGYRA